MEIFFLLGAVQALFFVSLFWRRVQIELPQKVLIILFLLTGILLFDHFLETKQILFQYPHLLGLTYTIPLLIGPVLLLYVLILTGNSPSDRRHFIGFHGALFVLLTVYFLVDFYFLSASDKLEYYVRESSENTSPMVYFTEFCLNFSMPIYSVWCLFILHDHTKKVKEKFSFTEEINLKWLKTILYSFTLISIISLITNFFSDVIPVISFSLGDDLIFTTLTFAVFFFGWFGIRQKVIFSDNDSSRNTSEKKIAYQKSGFKILQNDSNIQQLLKIMETEKPYLNGKLSLKELADQMELSENNLSQLINEGLNKSFYDFINEYRVEEVKQKMIDSEFEHLSLLGIAFECGFNSKSSFNNVFKKMTSMTPSEYKKLRSATK